MIVILWMLDLQLHMQSVPITINVASSNPAHGEVYSIHHYVGGFIYIYIYMFISVNLG